MNTELLVEFAKNGIIVDSENGTIELIPNKYDEQNNVFQDIKQVMSKCDAIMNDIEAIASYKEILRKEIDLRINRIQDILSKHGTYRLASLGVIVGNTLEEIFTIETHYNKIENKIYLMCEYVHTERENLCVKKLFQDLNVDLKVKFARYLDKFLLSYKKDIEGM